MKDCTCCCLVIVAAVCDGASCVWASDRGGWNLGMTQILRNINTTINHLLTMVNPISLFVSCVKNHSGWLCKPVNQSAGKLNERL